MQFQAGIAAQMLNRIRQKRPVIHAITNWVTAGDVANALLAIGARPVMASASEEVEEVVSRADALVLNLGTPDPSRVKAMLSAGHCANRLGRPIIFDPVGAGLSRFRMNAVETILSKLHLAVIRGNRAEIGTLAGGGGELRGIDSALDPPHLHSVAATLSQHTGAVVAVSGQRDIVVRDEQMVVIENGHPLMERVTGMGCMLTAIIAAFASVDSDPMASTVAAMACFGLGGEYAAKQARGPGTFKAALLDALFALTPEDLRGGAKIIP